MKISHILIVAFITLFSINPALGQTVTQTRALSFGTGVITNNSAQHEILLNADGSFSNDPEIIFETNPITGIYQLTGANPSETLNINIVVDQQLLGPGTDFIIDNFDIDAPATTSISGGATIILGARMRTTGDSSAYANSTTFTGQFTITATTTP
ncbi:hypothetical protein N9Z27_02280 [Alphaproteobacteria bacterium]|nr:hypothetical protein [Alphaproteobacteria bacterium]